MQTLQILNWIFRLLFWIVLGSIFYHFWGWVGSAITVLVLLLGEIHYLSGKIKKQEKQKNNT